MPTAKIPATRKALGVLAVKFFALRFFAVGFFAVAVFAVRIFHRTEIPPYGVFTIRNFRRKDLLT